MEFTIREIGVYVLNDRSMMIGAMLVLVLIVSISMWATAPRYRSTMIVAPASTGLATNTPNSASALEGFGALLGRKQDVTSFNIYLKYYNSLELASWLDSQHGLMKIVFARQWDLNHKAWRPRKGIAAFFLRSLRSLYGVSESDAPTEEDLRDYLARTIVITPGDGEEMQTISATDTNPKFARDLILWAHQGAERLAKARVQVSTSANIAYLEQKLSVVTQADQHQSLGALLTSQENQLMMLQSWNGYASDIIEAPAIPSRPYTPNPPLMLILAIIGGLIMGAAISVVRMMSGAKARPHLISLPPRRREPI